jgi:hypothetical protein
MQLVYRYTRVASHAQKYFIRQNNLNKRKRRSSLFDIVSEAVSEVTPPTTSECEAAGEALINRSTLSSETVLPIKPNHSTYQVKPFHLSSETVPPIKPVIPFKRNLYRYSTAADSEAAKVANRRGAGAHAAGAQQPVIGGLSMAMAFANNRGVPPVHPHLGGWHPTGGIPPPASFSMHAAIPPNTGAVASKGEAASSPADAAATTIAALSMAGSPAAAAGYAAAAARAGAGAGQVATSASPPNIFGGSPAAAAANPFAAMMATMGQQMAAMGQMGAAHMGAAQMGAGAAPQPGMGSYPPNAATANWMAHYHQFFQQMSAAAAQQHQQHQQHQHQHQQNQQHQIHHLQQHQQQQQQQQQRGLGLPPSGVTFPPLMMHLQQHPQLQRPGAGAPATLCKPTAQHAAVGAAVGTAAAAVGVPSAPLHNMAVAGFGGGLNRGGGVGGVGAVPGRLSREKGDDEPAPMVTA